ncbi:MAG: alpha/beta hydrolase family protein [Acidimicrobiia bacterium]
MTTDGDGFVEPDDDEDEWVATPHRQRNFSPWAQVQLELASIEREEAVPTDPSVVPGWRARTRGRLTDLLGAFGRPVPLDPEVTDREARGSYTRERVVFDVQETMSVPAYLLVPNARTRPGPAILAVHGHGPGKDEVVGIDSPEVRAAAAQHQGDYAHRLAEAGYVVLAPDLREFGERADWAPDDKYLCDANLVAAAAVGRNPLADNLHDLVCSLDLLSEHHLVDAARVGVAGFSYGGTMALFLAAWDTRVRAAVVSGYFSSWRAAHRMPYNLCGSQVLFGMLGQIEHVDLAALIAPRALLVETGTEDDLFPVAAARDAVAELQSVYDAMRAPPHALEHHVFEGGHRWDGASVLAFFDRWL